MSQYRIKERKFIELPGPLQRITKEREFLSISKDYFGYKGKQVVVTGADSGKGDVATKGAALVRV